MPQGKAYNIKKKKKKGGRDSLKIKKKGY